MNARAFVLLTLLPLAAQGQGFAGLGTEAAGLRAAGSRDGRWSFRPITDPTRITGSSGGI